MSVIEVNDVTFQSEIQKKELTLVEFGAVWCPPCKALLPILGELSEKYGEQVSILKLDCDESPITPGSFGIMSMPTVIVFHNGEPVEKLVGLRPMSVYENVLSKYMATV
ncbi:thioredoxin family protein [Paenibacillus sp. D2_2]|uniref:thioredoxin family protein n=1 Tax=Paenibacillus sp. D2_2 TaxID=3073092 RepID=UPI00281681CC|nr:thioredoxin family protein [Paenibacillus sp. D2_2]WMT39000.1 thioredoxin family protein [Paenibacillus sp. D2_2]